MAELGLFANPQDIQRAQDMQMAQLTPEQRMYMMGAHTGRAVGKGLGSLFGVDVSTPEEQQGSLANQLAKKYGVASAEAFRKMALEAHQQGQTALALKFSAQADEMEKKALAAQKTQSDIVKNLSEKTTPEQKNAAALADASGAVKGTPEWTAAYNDSLKQLTTKVENKTEFESILSSLGLPTEQEKALKQQWISAKLNPDPSGMKAVQAQLLQLQIEQGRAKLEKQQQDTADAKKLAVTKLADVESNIESSLSTAEKAMKLAPGTFLEASQQALLSQIPWSDQKSMANLVSSLNSDKAIATLETLKTQSRTGATGFGALNTRELQLILDKTRALDPTDKMFKENLTFIMNGWKKIKDQAMTSRLELQGKGEKLTELRSKIATVKRKGSMSSSEKADIEALKDELGVK